MDSTALEDTLIYLQIQENVGSFFYPAHMHYFLMFISIFISTSVSVNIMFCICHVFYVWHMPYSSLLTWFDHPDNVPWNIQITEQKGQKMCRKKHFCCYRYLKVMKYCDIFWGKTKILSKCHTVNKIIQTVVECVCVLCYLFCWSISFVIEEGYLFFKCFSLKT